MPNLRSDLNSQKLELHKDVLTSHYNISHNNITDIADSKLHYDFILQTKKSDDLEVECKTCYATTPNMAIEIVAAVSSRAIDNAFVLKGNVGMKIKPNDSSRKKIFGIIEQVENEEVDSKKGYVLASKADCNFFSHNHRISYLRENRNCWFLLHTQNFMKWILDNDLLNELPWFMTYTGDYHHNTIGLLIPQSKVISCNRQLQPSEQFLICHKQPIE